MKRLTGYRVWALACAMLLYLTGSVRLSAQLPSTEHHYFNLSKGDVILLPNGSYGWGWDSSSSKWVNKPVGGSDSDGWGSSSDVIQHIVMDPDGKFNGTDSSLDVYRGAVTTTTSSSSNNVNIVDRTDVSNVLTQWNTRATAQERPSTNYRIVVSCNVKYTVLLDNIWSTYQENSSSRATGGISFFPQTDGAKFHVYLKGDNRFGNVFYSSTWTDLYSSYGYKRDKRDDTDVKVTSGNITYYKPKNVNFTTAEVIFKSATASGSDKGTLTVGNVSPGSSFNYYNSVIGASDHPASHENSRGITIEGGTVFAGAETGDDCTAIGGGGNGVGVVTVKGGVVTAVTSSTGTALGGGIGWSDSGGEGTVSISGGTVYAYNFGIVHNGNVVPSAAIGGASSGSSAGALGTVTITGGTVYAQSTGGVAIGGGGSASSYGGNAAVSISGNNTTVTAKSISSSAITYGSAIGGGVGGGGNGGNCTFSMSSGTLLAGSVGGGSTNKSGAKVGSANITITGGDIRAQFVMASGGTSASSFSMSAGTIHNSNTSSTDFLLKQANGGALWQGDSNGTVNITGGTIDNCQATNGGAIYTTGGTVTVSNASITNCTATGNGGAFFLEPGAAITMNSGSIEGNSAVNGGGVYLSSKAKLTYNTTTGSTGYIRGNSASQLGGGVYLAQGTTSDKTQLTFNLGSPNLGFYDNTAGVGADDIYAYGGGTTRVTIPNVSSMNLGGYSVAGATLEWYEDYRESDSRYSLGTQQGDATAIRRYRAARDAFLPVWKLPSSSLSTFYEKYLCLTLGFEFASMEIRRSGLLPRQSAVFKVEFQGESLGRPTQYVTVLGTAEEEKLQDGGVRWNYARIGYLPKGSYKVTEIPWTWYKSDKTVSATEKTQDISTEAGRIYEFTNGTAPVATLPRHDEERKENELVP